ncbi:MAG: beta-ketoacyl-ACP synthase II [Myxococcota bacterium]|nr:beta-ketoacyl-ACP synthase II [Myxococcota bacterium]MEC8425128.1 beta-ketoacyl-ACP synthase II [Myxococcota bacterium]
MRRVVVTGLGAVSPCGNDVGSTWDSVVAGRSGVGPLTAFDAADWPVRIAAQADAFDPSAVLDRRQLRRHDRFSQLGMAACLEAVRDAGFPDGFGHDEALSERAGVYLGSGIGGIGEIETGSVALRKEGPRGLSAFFIPRSLGNLASGQVAIALEARGPSLNVSTACATGNHSIGEAARAIRAGDADVIVAGGAEAPITPVSLAGFMVMRALSKNNDDPEAASRPFDAARDGFVMGEGAGVVVLEAYEHARARGARILAELVGYGLTTDAHHITAPAPGHGGAARCMQMALRSAGMAPEAVDYINAHGTSTPVNDPAEVAAIKTVFGDHARSLMVSSTKSVTGHLLGAAGGLEAVLTIRAMMESLVPPTATLQDPDPACDLDHVPGSAREARVGVAVSNAFGFGGTNAVLVFRNPEA